MYSFLDSEIAASVVAVQKQLSLGDLRCALRAIDDASALLSALTTDTEWEAKGVRALRELLVDFVNRTLLESLELRAREHELTKAGAL